MHEGDEDCIKYVGRQPKTELKLGVLSIDERIH
jgi:hypothetical protein